ncbi:MAG: hypothetical protein IT287_08520 [Bdellovibrionaceae bacterium]|nr:hypothetical protein [Pseudobdellovibrionaceae bacterium]
MDPRLKTSTKWTPFPLELSAQIADVMTESFADYDLGGKFVVEGAIFPQELLLRIGLQQSGKLRQDNFEASLEYVPEVAALEDTEAEAPTPSKTIELIHVMVDFLGQVWESFLEDEPELEEMPLGWLEHRFEKQVISLRYTSVNTDLEKQADELLKMYEKKLVHESEAEEGDDVAAENLEASDEDSHDEHNCDDPTHLH